MPCGTAKNRFGHVLIGKHDQTDHTDQSPKIRGLVGLVTLVAFLKNRATKQLRRQSE